MDEQQLALLGAAAACAASPNLAARLRSLLALRYDTSIVRRVALLSIFVGPAFLANLLVYYFTARILTPANFGLFYVAITIGNVAFSGSLMLNIFFTRYLSQFSATRPADAAAAMRRVQRIVGLCGAAVALAGLALLAAISKSVGMHSSLVVLLIIADTYASYLADLGRAFLQSRRQTLGLGCYTLAWMGLRLVFCLLASAWLGTVWAALLGCACGPALVFVGLQFLLVRSLRSRPHLDATQAKHPKLPTFIALLPVAFGYGLLIVISNLDILLIYFLFKDQEIGIYSASSVLPKGILVVTLPVSQMLFAVMMSDHESDKAFRMVVRKTIVVIGAMAAAAALGVWIFTPWLCGGSFGLKLCAPAPLHLLLLSAVTLSLLRITVLLEFVRRQDWLILSLIVPAITYLLVVWLSKPTIETVALQFTVFSAATLIFFIAVQWTAARWRGIAGAR